MSANNVDKDPISRWGLVAVLVAALGLGVVAANAFVVLFVMRNADPFFLVISTFLASNLLVVGAFIAVHRPGNAIGSVLLACGLTATISFTGSDYAALDRLMGGDRLPGVALVTWVSTWTFVPTVILLAIVLPLTFPDGNLPSPRWRPALLLILALVSLNWVQAAFAPGQLQVGDVAIENPLGWRPPYDRIPDIAGAVGTAAAPFAFAFAIAGLTARFRRSGPVERAQLKWFALAAGIAGIAFAPAVFNVGLVSDLGWAVGLSALACLPIAIGIAIVRYRLYDIDRVISRTIAYALTTGAVVVVFGALVLSLQAVLAGVTQGQAIPVAVSTLAAASLFQPVRRRIQGVVNRRFNRARVDAEQTVAAFAERLRDDVDLDRLGSAIESTVVTSLQPSTLGVWLRPTGSAQ
jgi:hypothetical protein